MPLLFALTTSCAATEPPAGFELWLTRCDDRDAPCTASDSAEFDDLDHREGEAFVDRQVSRNAPDGAYIYFEMPAGDGATGLVELDLSTAGEAPTGDRQLLRYREIEDQRVVFESSHAEGAIVLPSALGGGPACGCDDIGFDLRFVDHGEDGLEGGGDDRTRLLSRGTVWVQANPCRTPPRIAAEAEATLTVEVESCPLPPPPSAVAPATPTTTVAPATPSRVIANEQPVLRDEPTTEPQAVHSDDSVGCHVIIADGCAGDSESSADSGSCEGGSSAGSSSSSDSGGCESDSSSSSDSGGCEGDTSDAPESCEVAPRRRRRSGGPMLGVGLPLLLACGYQLRRARKLRRWAPN
ncbi:MAG: hypothetical protein OEZ06_10760 [Myxococcales bacterium]|nr:hypothetical protein [Myxococcales bacterium]